MYYKFLVLIFIYTVFGFKLSLLGTANDDKNSSLLASIRIDDIIIVLFLIVYFGILSAYFRKGCLLLIVRGKLIGFNSFF